MGGINAPRRLRISMKPAVGAGVTNTAAAVPVPAALSIRKRIESGDVGFDVQQRCAIEHINIFYRQLMPVNRNEPDNRKPDGVRPLRRPGRKDTMRDRIQVRDNLEFMPAYPVERINEDEPGEAFEIPEPGPELLIERDRAPHTPGTGRLDGHANRIGKRGTNSTDGSERNNRFVFGHHDRSPEQRAKIRVVTAEISTIRCVLRIVIVYSHHEPLRGIAGCSEEADGIQHNRVIHDCRGPVAVILRTDLDIR